MSIQPHRVSAFANSAAITKTKLWETPEKENVKSSSRHFCFKKTIKYHPKKISLCYLWMSNMLQFKLFGVIYQKSNLDIVLRKRNSNNWYQIHKQYQAPLAITVQCTGHHKQSCIRNEELNQ